MFGNEIDRHQQTRLGRDGSLDGYLLQLTAVNRFCFIHHGAEAAIGAANCRDNGGVEVDRGLHIATHLNIVTNDPVGM